MPKLDPSLAFNESQIALTTIVPLLWDTLPWAKRRIVGWLRWVLIASFPFLSGDRRMKLILKGVMSTRWMTCQPPVTACVLNRQQWPFVNSSGHNWWVETCKPLTFRSMKIVFGVPGWSSQQSVEFNAKVACKDLTKICNKDFFIYFRAFLAVQIFYVWNFSYFLMLRRCISILTYRLAKTGVTKGSGGNTRGLRSGGRRGCTLEICGQIFYREC